MIRLLALVGLLLAWMTAGAQAQSSAYSTLSLGAYYTLLTGTAAIVVDPNPGVFYGVYSMGTQLNPLQCYDNPSAASGQLLYSKVVPSLGDDFPPIGIVTQHGLTCIQPLGIVSGIMVLWH